MYLKVNGFGEELLEKKKIFKWHLSLTVKCNLQTLYVHKKYIFVTGSSHH